MGKGRAPCCDKNQVKRGPWSPAEDLRLITFIQNHGHDNWRALPKQAGTYFLITLHYITLHLSLLLKFFLLRLLLRLRPVSYSIVFTISLSGFRLVFPFQYTSYVKTDNYSKNKFLLFKIWPTIYLFFTSFHSQILINRFCKILTFFLFLSYLFLHAFAICFQCQKNYIRYFQK